MGPIRSADAGEARPGSPAGPRADQGPAIRCDGLSMSYVPGIWVLKDVSFALEPGTVTAVVGENGAGKSTLYRILAGLQKPTAGTVSVAGGAPGEAGGRSGGVVYVPQELAPCPDLRVYENLYLGAESTKGRWMVDRRTLAARAREATRRFDTEIDPYARARTLGTSALQVIEIAKSIRTRPAVWILDEPTSSLGDAQVSRLFEVIETMRDAGTCILYTTHRMDEIRKVADRVLILRDGGLVADTTPDQVSEKEMVDAMLGRQSRDVYPALAPPKAADVPALEISGFKVGGLRGTFDLALRPGEIVGLAGLVGAGRSELLEGIFGARPAQGRVRVSGQDLPLGQPAVSMRRGLALVPEDRKRTGLVLELSVCDNITLPWLASFGRVLRRDRQRRLKSEEVAERTRLRAHSVKQRVSRLSGGNQQKVLIGRNLAGSVRVLLLDEPTRGVDVGARAEIYEVLRNLAAQGLAILMASSDRDEVVNLSHRVLVMRGGEVVGETASTDSEARAKVLRLSLGYDHETGNDV